MKKIFAFIRTFRRNKLFLTAKEAESALRMAKAVGQQLAVQDMDSKARELETTKAQFEAAVAALAKVRVAFKPGRRVYAASFEIREEALTTQAGAQHAAEAAAKAVVEFVLARHDRNQRPVKAETIKAEPPPTQHGKETEGASRP